MSTDRHLFISPYSVSLHVFDDEMASILLFFFNNSDEFLIPDARLHSACSIHLQLVLRPARLAP